MAHYNPFAENVISDAAVINGSSANATDTTEEYSVANLM